MDRLVRLVGLCGIEIENDGLKLDKGGGSESVYALPVLADVFLVGLVVVVGGCANRVEMFRRLLDSSGCVYPL